MVGESPNDRNDRGTELLNYIYVQYIPFPVILCTLYVCSALYSPLLLYSAIRVAARWYQSHLGDSAKVLLVTNDRDNKRKATEEGLNAETGASWIVCYMKFIAESFTILHE